jgi:glycosyltransferase involved in cell wall biosynthesis
MNPLVSVIIPTYKRPTNLKRAIESVLNQNYDNIEIS